MKLDLPSRETERQIDRTTAKNIQRERKPERDKQSGERQRQGEIKIEAEPVRGGLNPCPQCESQNYGTRKSKWLKFRERYKKRKK